MTGLLFVPALEAVDQVVDDRAAWRPGSPRPRLALREAAADLLASWWLNASGLGVGRGHLARVGNLPRIALDVLVDVDRERELAARGRG